MCVWQLVFGLCDAQRIFPKRGANQLVATLAAASVLDRILRSANSLTLDSGLHTLWQAARCTSKLRGANDIMVASPAVVSKSNLSWMMKNYKADFVSGRASYVLSP